MLEFLLVRVQSLIQQARNWPQSLALISTSDNYFDKFSVIIFYLIYYNNIIIISLIEEQDNNKKHVAIFDVI